MSGVLPQRLISEAALKSFLSGKGEIDVTHEEWRKVGITKKRLIRDSY